MSHPPSIAASVHPPRVAAFAQQPPAELFDILADLPDPTPERVAAARKAAGQSQSQAAALAGYGHLQRWSDIERGVANMDRARWAMYLLAIGAHPALQVVARVRGISLP